VHVDEASDRPVEGEQPAGRSLAGRLRAFFAVHVWRVAASEVGGVRGLGYAAARLLDSVARGFVANRITLRSAALTYGTVLSGVPFLAFAFAVLKGLGAYAAFIDQTVRPSLRATFGGNPALLSATEAILQFVDRTNMSTLGVVGLVTLVYTSVTLLGSVESALNDVWGARSARPFLRQVTDYVTLLVTTPILIVVATTFAAAAESSSMVVFLRETLQLGAVIDAALRFTSTVVVGAALFALYTILPNVHVRPASAFLGAGASALLWQGLLMLHVHFQVGVASYNALYSVLGAVPIFLVWTYFSWIIVLTGAQVAASHQNDLAPGQRILARRTDQALREALAVLLAAHVARDFLAGRSAPGGPALAGRLRIPRAIAAEVLEALVSARLLARAVSGREPGYLPGRDPGTIHLTALRDALRRDPSADAARAEISARIPAPLRAVLEAGEAEAQASRANLTLRELAELLPREPSLRPADTAAPLGSPGIPAPVER